MKLIYVASPYAGDVEKNTTYARAACRAVLETGNLCFAPHLLYPQFLNDDIPAERQLGIDMGIATLTKCDELWAFGDHISDGMRSEIEAAKLFGIPVLRMELEMDGSGCRQIKDASLNNIGRDWKGITVEQFLRENPDVVLDIMTPFGDVHIGEAERQNLLDGQPILANAGCRGMDMPAQANEVLTLEIETVARDRADLKVYHLFTDYQEQAQGEGPAMMETMSM